MLPQPPADSRRRSDNRNIHYSISITFSMDYYSYVIYFIISMTKHAVTIHAAKIHIAHKVYLNKC